MAQDGKHLSPSEQRRAEGRKPKQDAYRLSRMESKDSAVASHSSSPAYLNLGDSLAIFALAVTVITYALNPTVAVRLICLLFGITLLAYLSYRSHFTRDWTSHRRHIAAISLNLVIAVVGGCQIYETWRSVNTIKALTTSPATSPLRPAYSVSMGGALIREDNPLSNLGPYAFAACGASNAVIPIDYMPELFITNKQSGVYSTIDFYELYLMGKSGQWEKLVRIPLSYSANPRFVFFHEHEITGMRSLVPSLDEVMGHDHGIAPGATVNGAVYFAFGANHTPYAYEPRTRIHIHDFSGNSFDGEVTRLPSGPSRTIEHGLSFSFLPRIDPSSIKVIEAGCN